MTTHKPELAVLFGSLRSGSTMLRLMLNGHPRLICPGETDFLTDYLVPASGGSWQYDIDALAADRIFQDSRASLPQTAEAIPAFRAMVSDLRGGEEGLLVVVAHRGLDRLLRLVPRIPIIHLVRDPRDVAQSAVGMGWAGNTYFGARTWLSTELEWERVQSYNHPTHNLELRYEALVREPEVVLSEICKFLGDNYEPEMLKYPDYTSYESPDPSLADQWRHRQTERSLGLTEFLFGNLLTKRGYRPSGYPIIAPGKVGRVALRVEHLISVWRRRIARYGVRDPLVVMLSAKLGVKALARPAQRRMDAITRQNLK